MGESIDRL